ncbi:sulfatase [Streptomyces luteolus]|uniref:Sulfatase n=1 Tax=Streptomyces luteolus TaxID=3043615 RepID=A0ABT6SQK2_9ACTN|nr:sulfatase [Streptomyces sp. B-S-A12]MDI3417855.1 sulfatase [Streptomyces sp. B-S-A12]
MSDIDLRLRLLPWSSEDGKPCYLSSDDPHSTLSRLADDIEEEQLECGEAVLAGARAVLDDSVAGERAVRFALARAVESLREVLRIAVSRGGRIPASSGAVVPDQGLDQA